MLNRLVIRAGQPALARHLLDGWHAAEDWCAWSAAPTARVLMPLRQGDGVDGADVRVTLVAGPTGGPYPGLRITANGVALQPVADVVDGAYGFAAHVADTGPWLLLEFTVAELVVPAAAGLSPDLRALGVGLKRIEVDQRLPDTPPADTPPAAPTWLAAHELLHPARLDLAVKARFFHALASGHGLEPARAAYLRHISLRTGGIEPPDHRGHPSAKHVLADYELGCRALLMSMQADGFDAAHAVPLGRALRPLNGAHRIACALALGQPVAVTHEPRDAGSWDMPWFEQAGYAKRDRLRLLYDLARLAPERCCVFVLWPHAVDVWDSIVEQMRAAGCEPAGHVDLAWSEAQRPACESLVFDMYSYGITDFVDGFGHIERKLGFLRAKPCFLRVGVLMLQPGAGGGWDAVPALKAAIRQQHAARVPVDQFVTCHLGDTVAESQHLARTLFVPESLDAALSRPAAQPRRQFLSWLNDYGAALRAHGLQADDCCIVGSAGLEVQGLRLSTDIDFTVRGAIRSARFTPGVTHLAAGIDLVTAGYHRNLSGPAHSDDELIAEAGLHVYFRGFKVAAPALVRDRKAHSRRPKDLLDLELMSALPEQCFAAGC